METIKALLKTSDLRLGELKPMIDQALPHHQREANDRLYAEVIAAMKESTEHLVASEGSLSNIQARGDGPYACPCCGYLTLGERGGDEICQVCFWHDDGQDSHDADIVRGGPNYELSLSQARANFARIGACTERVLNFVRAPRPDERR